MGQLGKRSKEKEEGVHQSSYLTFTLFVLASACPNFNLVRLRIIKVEAWAYRTWVLNLRGFAFQREAGASYHNQLELAASYFTVNHKIRIQPLLGSHSSLSGAVVVASHPLDPRTFNQSTLTDNLPSIAVDLHTGSLAKDFNYLPRIPCFVNQLY